MKLERRIHNQRVQLRWWARSNHQWSNHWMRSALAYRKQLIDAGIKPKRVWSPLYKNQKPETR